MPLSPDEISWYVCGPTVYDDSHMGHARNYVQWDIIRRIMTEYFGYNIKLCMNITDLDDKIIRKAMEQGRDFSEVSRHYETSFLEDMRRLNVALPDVITRVSEYMDEIVVFIEKIIENGYAYESGGSVYFDVTKFDNFEANQHSYAKLEPTSVSLSDRTRVGDATWDKLKKKAKNDNYADQQWFSSLTQK